MFINVLRKFFTAISISENKGSTNTAECDQQKQFCLEVYLMIEQIKNTLQHSPSTLLQDAVGAASLIVMLVVALHMPGLI
jgi:hypothetical protein